MHQKKASFWTEVFMTCDTPSFWNLPILVLSNKTENMQPSIYIITTRKTPYHISCHEMMSVCRAYFRFNNKTKHMRLP